MNKNIYSKSKTFFKYFILSFLSFILVVSLLFSLLSLLKIKVSGKNNIIKENFTENETSNNVILQGERNILFTIINKNEYLFSFTTCADYDNRNITINYYDASYHKNIGSINNLKNKINDDNKKIIDKYICIDKSQLNLLLSFFDSFTICLPYDKEINTENGLITISKGENIVSTDYMNRLLLGSDDDLRKYLILSLVKESLKLKYANQKDILFKNIINLVQTDISIIDYSENIDNIIYMINMINEFSIEVGQ